MNIYKSFDQAWGYAERLMNGMRNNKKFTKRGQII